MGQVLLVEDTPFFERVIKRQLSTSAGLDVISVPTRADAERVIADPAITLDVALVDLTLPDAPDGEIVDVTMAACLPTIVFSGRFDERLRDTLLAKGVVDYILKDNASSLAYVTTLVQRVYANRRIDALVVDDSRVDLEIVARRLRLYQLNVHTAVDHTAALALIDTLPNLRLVVLDYLMPSTDGFDLLRNLRARYGMHELAVIGLSGQAGPEIIARFLKSGANDFLPKSCTPEEFMLRISQNLDTLDRIQALADMAHRDALTGLSNRRHLFSQGRGIFDAARHRGAGARVASIDIDRFKSVNDTHGHEAGDALIKAFGRALADCCPPQAFPARLGGDEFCVILPDLAPDACARFLDDLRLRMRALTSSDGSLCRIGTVTLSIGLDDGGAETLEDALHAADIQLYAAKSAGRDRVVAS
ncbi:diguanylate cyclase domain-containing protein [Stappia stellulata]|uniref:diguanylate cyclase domain-containing protein n=1 Tax=Stappia stellulata TaxID=71235 RepID=UPI000425CA34|nr:diguanylate cyclase [Stappia stellulata]